MPQMIEKTDFKIIRQSAAFVLSFQIVLVSSVNSYILQIDQTLDSFRLTQKRALTFEEVDLVDSCGSEQRFERLGTALGADLAPVEVHPDAWVFATSCMAPGKPCRGIARGIHSMCRPKKSWVQVYGRVSGAPWRQHWVAVDTACVCSIRRKMTRRPLGGFFP